MLLGMLLGILLSILTEFVYLCYICVIFLSYENLSEKNIIHRYYINKYVGHVLRILILCYVNILMTVLCYYFKHLSYKMLCSVHSDKSSVYNLYYLNVYNIDILLKQLG